MDFRQYVHAFVAAFNQNDLTQVMAMFSDDACYVTFDGKTYKGKPAIEAAFVPQFRGDFGRLYFEIEDLIVDETLQQAVVTWQCVHQPQEKSQLVLKSRLSALLLSLFANRFKSGRLAWQGVDVFKFENGLLAYKATYAQAYLPKFNA